MTWDYHIVILHFFPVEGYIILSHYIATKSLDQPLSTIIDHYQPLSTIILGIYNWFSPYHVGSPGQYAEFRQHDRRVQAELIAAGRVSGPPATNSG